MKRKVNLQELVTELKKQNLQKRDIVVPASYLSMENGQIIVNNPTANPELSKILYETGISETGEGNLQRLVLDRLETIDPHLVDKLGIPTKYFDKCDTEENLRLLDQNVNHWLGQLKGNYMLRTFVDKDEQKGVARALLSDRFRVIDNYDILLATLQAIAEVKKETGYDIQLDEQGADVSDKRLYLRFICPDVEIQAPQLLKNYRPNGQNTGRGNGIISGFIVSNSEVGGGQFSIAARAKILICDNGAMSTQEKFNQRHLGAKMEQFQTWSDESKQKNLELVIAQLKDSVREYVSPECLGRVVAHLEEKAGYEVKYPSDCVKQVTQSIGISEDKAEDILNMFIKSGDTSAFGVAQALTLYAHTKGDADLQYDMERQAMEVLDTIETFDKPLAKKVTSVQSQLN